MTEGLSAPHLSVVMTARNDDHGGHMLHRLQLSLGVLLTLAERFGLRLELILVEWNPPTQARRLSEVLDFSPLGSSSVRIIEVPPSLHARLHGAERMPFFQFVGKNIGIRRAEGTFIVATNLDIVFSSSLVEFLASGRLSAKCFYRMDRHDVASKVPLEMAVEEKLQFCERHVVRIHRLTGVFEPALQRSLARRLRDCCAAIKQSFRDGIHTAAAGDFTLMARERWHALRGYPEITSHAYVDGLICYVAAASGLRQVVVCDPLRIYHQDHDEMFLGTASERPLVDYRQYREWCAEMLRARMPRIFNDDSWGFSQEQLQETRLGAGEAFKRR